MYNRGTLKLAAVSTLELENPVGFDNSKGRIETSGKIKINDSGLTEAQQQAPQDIDMGDIRLSGADAMLLSWDKGYTLSTDKDKDKDKRKARVNFGSVELLDGAHFSQSKNALDSGDSMTIGRAPRWTSPVSRPGRPSRSKSVVAFGDAPASCESQTVEELYQSNLL